MFGQLGRPDGLFVTTSAAADRIEKASKGDREVLKHQLGIPQQYWNERIYRVDISAADQRNLRMPGGFEQGANDLFRWGGYTSGGIPEAVIDPIPASKVKGRCVAK